MAVYKVRMTKFNELLFCIGELGVKNERKNTKRQEEYSKRNQKSIQQWPEITHKRRLEGQIRVFILK